MTSDQVEFDPLEEGADFVSAVVARSRIEAHRYRDLLEDHGIPAIIEAQKATPPRRPRLRQGIPVLVPEALLDEASEIIADRENLSEFQLGQENEQEEEEEEEEDEDEDELEENVEEELSGEIEDEEEDDDLFDEVDDSDEDDEEF